MPWQRGGTAGRSILRAMALVFRIYLYLSLFVLAAVRLGIFSTNGDFDGGSPLPAFTGLFPVLPPIPPPPLMPRGMSRRRGRRTAPWFTLVVVLPLCSSSYYYFAVTLRSTLALPPPRKLLALSSVYALPLRTWVVWFSVTPVIIGVTVNVYILLLLMLLLIPSSALTVSSHLF